MYRIGDVDCTDDTSKDLCDKYSVQGYPTIKYFVDGDTTGKDYQGGRDFDTLKAHVEEHLQVHCDVTDPGDDSSSGSVASALSGEWPDRNGPFFFSMATSAAAACSSPLTWLGRLSEKILSLTLDMAD